MLEKVKLVNFQKHKKLVLELDPEVTTIIGETNAGKSTVLRSLAFVGLNIVPKGSVARFGKDVAKAVLYVDGHKILRKKGKGVNVYQLDSREASRSVATGVPDEIAEILNLDGINFQWQRDMPFWFSESSGQVSKNLNQIVNLGSIDRTIANVGSELRKVKAEVDVSKSRLEEALEKRKELEWVPDLMRDYARLSDSYEAWRSRAFLLASMAKLCQSGTLYARQLDRASNARRSGEKLIAFLARLVETSERKQDLSGIIQKAVRLKKNLKVKFPDIDELAAFRKEADQVAENRRILESLVREAQEAKERLCKSEVALVKHQKKFARKVKGKCPVCGRKWKKKLSGSSLPTFTCETNHQSPVERWIGTE